MWGLSRFLVAVLLLVGAGHPHAAGTQATATPVPGFFDLTVPGGLAAYEALGLAPEERGVALAILARALHGQGTDHGEAARQVAAALAPPVPGNAPADDGSPAITIAAPLTADHWRDLLELRGRTELLPALLANRSVLLVCAATLAADPSIQQLLERDRALLRWLARTAPGGFTVVARALRIENERIAVPGGPEAVPIWEALAGEKVSRPADFIRALVTRDSGRLASFYDTVAAMSADRYAAAIGPGPLDLQIEQARALLDAFRAGEQNWRLEQHPFLRSVADSWMVTTQIAIDKGAVAAPNWQWLWEAVFEDEEWTRRDAASLRRSPGSPVTLAWLAVKIASASPRERRDRYDMVRFAQGVFGTTIEADATDVVIAVGGYRRYRALLLTLDRLDIRAPRTYARAVEAAQRLTHRPGRELNHGLIALQGALAIIERARVARAISAATAEQLVLSLADAVDRNAPVASSVAAWITTTLSPALPPLVTPDRWTAKTAYESKILQAMAGPAADAVLPALQWEGLPYRLDLRAAEHQRILEIREQLESPGLDAALASGQASQIADALMAVIYSPALGDPAGPALLGADIITRHDFGLDAPATARREGLAWALPHDQVGDGAPWRVVGAILGLDLGLARLALRRLADNEMPPEPSINLNDQMTIARTILAINARDLTDSDRDRIVQAIERGRQRVLAAGTNVPALQALAAASRLSASVRQTLTWTATRAPEALPGLFGLRDLMWLGRPALAKPVLDRWGVYSEGLTGRLATAMPESAAWEDFGGRPDGGITATQAPDLILRLAQETARLKLPAQLIPSILMFAAQDYWHDVSARFPDDWPALTRQALALSPSRVEDYVAALAGNGPLRSQ